MDTAIRLTLVAVGVLILTLALFLPVDLRLAFAIVDAFVGVNDVVRWAIGLTGVAIAFGAIVQRS